MNNDIMQELWSWSVHTGDPLFADAAKEIERLRALITAWVDADDRKVTNVVTVELGPKASGPEDAAIALRKAIRR